MPFAPCVWRRSHFVPLDTSYPSDPSFVIFLHAPIPSPISHARASSSRGVLRNCRWPAGLAGSTALQEECCRNFLAVSRKSVWHSHHCMTTASQVEFFSPVSTTYAESRSLSASHNRQARTTRRAATN